MINSNFAVVVTVINRVIEHIMGAVSVGVPEVDVTLGTFLGAVSVGVTEVDVILGAFWVQC